MPADSQRCRLELLVPTARGSGDDEDAWVRLGDPSTSERVGGASSVELEGGSLAPCERSVLRGCELGNGAYGVVEHAMDRMQGVSRRPAPSVGRRCEKCDLSEVTSPRGGHTSAAAAAVRRGPPVGSPADKSDTVARRRPLVRPLWRPGNGSFPPTEVHAPHVRGARSCRATPNSERRCASNGQSPFREGRHRRRDRGQAD